jgi:hypothetical protein
VISTLTDELVRRDEVTVFASGDSQTSARLVAKVDFLARLEASDSTWQWPVIIADLADKPYSQVIGAQIAADIGLVNSLADGMNLVAKEFVARNYPPFLRGEFSQSLQGRFGHSAVSVSPGILVGSRLMGAYAELGDGMLPIDPKSVADTARGLYEAYAMKERARLDSDFEPAVDSLAYRAGELVSGNPQRDWLKKLLPGG